MSSIPIASDLTAPSATSTIAVGYAYLNTAAACGDNATLVDQEQAITSYARANGLALQAVVRETSESLSTRRQPHLERLIRGEFGGPWDVLLVARLDRLSRDIGHLSGMLSRLHDGGGRRLVSISEGIDTRQESGRFCTQLIQIFSRWDTAAIPDRTREWVAQKRNRGEPIGHAPYGYVYVNKVLVESPTEQEVIRIIRELRSKPLSYEKIARHLNSRGIPSKRGGGWYPETVKAVCSRAHAAPGADSSAMPADARSA